MTTRPLNPTFATLGTTVFTVMSALAAEHGAVNLGQGFPDTDGPREILAEAARRLLAGPNQYAPMPGLPELRQAVAAHDKRFYDLDYDWKCEVVVTSGATEAIADCLMALLAPGDEVVMFAPFYDCYLPMVAQAGAVARAIALQPPDWSLSREALEAAFSDRAKLVLLNTPMNPASKVFDPAELRLIAEAVVSHDAYAVCDEVYEHLTFDDRAHVPLATLPGMRERTLRIGSAGKTFSLTGWKVGYVSGPAHLVSAVEKAHQFVTFATNGALQGAVALGLALPDSYFTALAAEQREKRDRLRAILDGVGLRTLPCHGTYFITSDISGLGFNGDDYAFCRHLTATAGVAAIPLSVFYHPGGTDTPRHLIRFCFSKKESVLAEAERRLTAYFGGEDIGDLHIGLAR
jgi:N-succinyldiaminopimelate aminotransferase